MPNGPGLLALLTGQYRHAPATDQASGCYAVGRRTPPELSSGRKIKSFEVPSVRALPGIRCP